MSTRPTYRELDPQEKDAVQRVKELGNDFLQTLDDLQNGGDLPLSTTATIGREFALARTKIEEAVMWAVKGITK